MDWTDRHYRFLARMLTRHTLMYTEMVVDQTILHQRENLDYFLGHDPIEEPLVLQIGGSCPKSVRETIRLCVQHPNSQFTAFNLNVGCPSARVSERCFGARLMLEPELVRDVTHEMIREANGVPVSVKCRIGVDDLDSYDFVHRFVRTVAQSGVSTFIIHARKCILKGLNPHQNRTIPPLKYDVVHRLTRDFPDCQFTLNGGVSSLEQSVALLEENPRLDGIMIGRAAYNHPWMLRHADTMLMGCENDPGLSRRTIIEKYLDYAEDIQEQWKDHSKYQMKSSDLMKPMLTLFHHEYGSKRFKQKMSNSTGSQYLKTHGLRALVDYALEDTIDPSILDARF